MFDVVIDHFRRDWDLAQRDQDARQRPDAGLWIGFVLRCRRQALQIGDHAPQIFVRDPVVVGAGHDQQRFAIIAYAVSDGKIPVG